MITKKIPKRSEVRKEDTWATEDIFESDAAWEKAFAEAAKYPNIISSFKKSFVLLFFWKKIQILYVFPIEKFSVFPFESPQTWKCIVCYLKLF